MADTNNQYIGFVTCSSEDYAKSTHSEDTNILFYITDKGLLYKGAERIDFILKYYESTGDFYNTDLKKIVPEPNTLYYSEYGEYYYYNGENFIELRKLNDASNLTYSISSKVDTEKNENNNISENNEKVAITLTSTNKKGDEVDSETLILNNTQYEIANYDENGEWHGGLISSSDYKALKAVFNGQYENQNAFSTLLRGDGEIAAKADSPTATFQIVGSNGISTISENIEDNKLTIKHINSVPNGSTALEKSGNIISTNYEAQAEDIITIPVISYDSYGHINKRETINIILPKDTSYTGELVTNKLNFSSSTGKKDFSITLGELADTKYVPSVVENNNSNDNKKIPSIAKVNALINEKFNANDVMQFKGIISSANDLPTTNFEKGWTYRVSTDGLKIDTQICERGDIVICIRDYDSYSNLSNSWGIIQANIDNYVSDINAGDSSLIINKNGHSYAAYHGDTNNSAEINKTYTNTLGWNESTNGYELSLIYPNLNIDKYGHILDSTDENATSYITIPIATDSVAGLMSAADKERLYSTDQDASKKSTVSFTKTGTVVEDKNDTKYNIGTITIDGEQHSLSVSGYGKVKYVNEATDNKDYPILLANSINPEDGTINYIGYSGMTYNPSTGKLTLPGEQQVVVDKAITADSATTAETADSSTVSSTLSSNDGNSFTLVSNDESTTYTISTINDDTTLATESYVSNEVSTALNWNEV